MKKLVTMPVMAHPWPSSTDHGNCKYGCALRPAIETAPVGSPTPVVIERSNFPGIGLICHFTAGATSVNPEDPGPRNVVTLLGRSTNTSRHGATPRRSRLLVPSNTCAPSRRLTFIPFSFWKLPTGSTTLELVMSGRSVSIGLPGCVHSSAAAWDTPKLARYPRNTAIVSDRIKLMPPLTSRSGRGAISYQNVRRQMNDKNVMRLSFGRHARKTGGAPLPSSVE